MTSLSPEWLVECVPNFSEGQRPDVMDAIQQAAQAVPGCVVLNRHADAVHNRMVLTLVGTQGAIAEAAFRCVAMAAERIDLRTHHGVHPRIGAADVVPFVPLASTPMSVCVDLARRVGRRIGAELDLPVYLYAEAAASSERRRLPDLRKGEYEGLATRIETDPAAAPDFGPSRLGPAGAVAVSARQPLIAYNVTIAGDLATAKAISRLVRESSGGLPAVQARGFPTADPAVSQVSINLLDYGKTPLRVLFDAIKAEAERRGARVLASELVGLLPTGVLAELGQSYFQFPALGPAEVLESRVLEGLVAQASNRL